MSHEAFTTSAVHLGDDLTIEAEVHRNGDGNVEYASVRLGGYSEGVNVMIHSWQRDDLRRLADAAARAYHEWTKALHEAGGPAEAGEVMVSLAEAQAAIDREVGLLANEARSTDPTGIDAHETYEGIEA